MKKICPHCKQTLPSKFKHLGLRAGPELLLEIVADAGPEGIAGELLYHRLYGHRHDGGPDANTVRVRISQLNKRHLARYGMRIVGTTDGRRNGELCRYSLIETDESKIKLARRSQEIVAKNF